MFAPDSEPFQPGVGDFALRQQQRTHKLVVGHILRDALLNPLAINPHALLAQVLAVALEQVRPLIGPELNVVLVADEFVDQARLGYVVIDTSRATPQLRDFAIALFDLQRVETAGVFELYVPGIVKNSR